RKVDRQIAKVAIVDPDQRRAERDGAAHLMLVMNLDQRVHAETPGFGDHLPSPQIVEQRQQYQERVGASDPSLRHLTQIDKKVLRKDRSVERRPRRREVVERSAEKWAVAKHA